MMSSFCLMLAAVLLAQISWACDGDNEEQLLTTQDPEVSYARAYGYTPDTWNALDNQPASAGSPVDGKKSNKMVNEKLDYYPVLNLMYL